MLIPALRYRKIDFQVRPDSTTDSYYKYLNTRDYLAGITYQRIKYYKTSFLFRMGETEDVPAGYTAKLSGGYQDREIYGRTSAFFQTAGECREDIGGPNSATSAAASPCHQSGSIPSTN